MAVVVRDVRRRLVQDKDKLPTRLSILLSIAYNTVYTCIKIRFVLYKIENTKRSSYKPKRQIASMSIYFFRPHGKYGFLSNFYPVEFEKDNIWFANSEQAFVYSKCLTFEPTNIKLLKEILDEQNPHEVKKLGRNIKKYDEKVWNEIRYEKMVEVLFCKFNGNPEMKEALLDTEDCYLYEASPHDYIWGIGYDSDRALNIHNTNYGENLLGKALMLVRNLLRYC